MGIIIRENNKDDLLSIFQLLQNYYEEAGTSDLDRIRLNKEFVDKMYIVAEDGKIIGFLQYVIDTKILYQNTIYVLPEYRQKSVGGRMIRFLHNLAIKEGCTKGRLFCRLSKALTYKKHGYVPVSVIMEGGLRNG